MNKLEECRVKIDAIDNEIIRLYEERMRAVKEVAEYKIENGLEVLDSSREKKMLEKNLSKISKIELKKYYPRVLNGFLDASKEMQKDIIAKK